MSAGEPSGSPTANLPTIPNPAYHHVSITEPNRRDLNYEERGQFPQPRYRPRLDRDNLIPRFLLLCITTRKSSFLRQIDVTEMTHDEFLFQAIREAYLDVKYSKTWMRKAEKHFQFCFPNWIRWAMDLLSIYLRPEDGSGGVCRLEEANPFGIQLSYPPEEEVLEGRWDYWPCPKTFNNLRIPESIVATMLQDGNLFNDGAWLNLFPKKLNTKMEYASGEVNFGWGVNIVEGINYTAVTSLALAVVVGGGVISLVISAISGSSELGTRIAVWLTGIIVLLLALLQLNNK